MKKLKKYSNDINYKTLSKLKPSVIKDLNKHYNNDVFLNLSDEINLNILNYHFELIGDLNTFENTYKYVRNEFNDIIYSNIIHRGADYLQDLFDEDDELSLYDFIVPRLAKKQGTRRRDIYFNEIVPHINSGAFRSRYFISLFINFEKTISELICLFYNSLSDYYDHSTFSYRTSLFPNYELGKDDGPIFLFMRYDDFDDNDDDWMAIQDHIYDQQGERRIYFVEYNRQCGREGVFKEFYKMR